MLETAVFKGPDPGPHLLVLGAVHGNERCGALAQYDLIEQFKAGTRTLNRGTVTFVPVCNPRAYQAGARFVERDLNRCFHGARTPRSYEEQLAAAIVPLMQHADHVLDLHSVHTATDPFVFLDYPEQQALAMALPFDFVVTGWPEIYQSARDLNEGDTMEMVHRLGKTGILVECGQHDDPNAPTVARDSILSLLAHLGLTDSPSQHPASKTWLHMTRLMRRPKGAHFVKPWRNLSVVPSGETVALLEDGKPLRFAESFHILLPKPAAAIDTEWFYLAKTVPSPPMKGIRAAVTAPQVSPAA